MSPTLAVLPGVTLVLVDEPILTPSSNPVFRGVNLEVVGETTLLPHLQVDPSSGPGVTLTVAASSCGSLEWSWCSSPVAHLQVDPSSGWSGCSSPCSRIFRWSPRVVWVFLSLFPHLQVEPSSGPVFLSLFPHLQVDPSSGPGVPLPLPSSCCGALLL